NLSGFSDSVVPNSANPNFLKTTALFFFGGGSVDTGAGTLTLMGPVDKESSSLTQGASTMSGNYSLGNATVTFTNNNTNNSLVVPGILSGGGLTKTGGGAVILQGNNTYNGTTTVSAGILVVQGSQPNSAVIVSNGGTLIQGGAQDLVGNFLG